MGSSGRVNTVLRLSHAGATLLLLQLFSVACAATTRNNVTDGSGGGAGEGQGGARAKTRGASLRRYQRGRCRRGVVEARRRARDPGDRAERAGDFCARGWTVGEWQPTCPGRTGRAADGERAVVDHGTAIRVGLVFRHRERFARHVGIQRTKRRASDDREISAKPRGRSLRTDAQRQSTLPRSFDDVKAPSAVA